MSRSSAHKHYQSHRNVAYKQVGPPVDNYQFDSDERSFSGYMASMWQPMGRKIQNGSYLLISIAALITLSIEEDPSAAFTIYFSSDSSADKVGSLQIEWLNVATAAVSVIYYGCNTMNYGDMYELGVQRGFSYLRWVHFALVSALILCQLYIMECYEDLGGIFGLMLAVWWVADSLGTQEHQNQDYHQLEDSTSTINPEGDEEKDIRRKRWMYYAHSFVPLIGAIGLVAAQGIYYGIKGIGTMPPLLKVFIGICLGFMLAISMLSASHNFRFGMWKSNQAYEGTFLFLVFAWLVVSWIVPVWVMHQNNNLGYCGSTPVTTVN